MKKPAEPELVDNFHCGRLMLKPQVSRAFWDDADVDLTLTEFKIVHLLAANVGSYVTYRVGLRLHALRRLHRRERRKWLSNERPLLHQAD